MNSCLENLLPETMTKPPVKFSDYEYLTIMEKIKQEMRLSNRNHNQLEKYVKSKLL